MKKFKLLFVVICILLCVLPFAAMSFAKTQTTTENRRLSQMPVLFGEEGINHDYLQELGSYFDDHFAGRSLMVNIDSLIQGNLFQVSNASTVIKGTDGWLYYSDTLDDYLGQNVLSDRGIYNAARNISIMQEYVTDKGAKFALAIAPNKNSLYSENMPFYYSEKISDNKNITALVPVLNKNNINYVDLFSLFSSFDETLYLKRDSHWNNKGAMLVYNELMDNLKANHNDYSMVKSSRTKTQVGDLNNMLYPVTAQPEWNYYYQFEDEYEYVTDTQSVEDAWIQTAGSGENESLLMFRDSFGNTLLPFFAREFKNAYFSKAAPYALEYYMEEYSPEYVIVEKVERNIDEFAFDPPVLTAVSEHKISDDTKKINDAASVTVSEYEGNVNYLVICGTVDESCLSTDSDIYVTIDGVTYCAFNISDNSGDNGYRLYLKKEAVNDKADISVIISSNGSDTVVKEDTVNFDNIG